MRVLRNVHQRQAIRRTVRPAWASFGARGLHDALIWQILLSWREPDRSKYFGVECLKVPLVGVKLLTEELGRETDRAVVYPQRRRQRHRRADDRGGALDAREAQVEAREVQVEARETQVEAREASRAERLADARDIRVGAEQRDEQAEGRDRKARKRDMAANAESWLHDDDRNGKAHADRNAARQDRRYAKDDRISSAVDRSLLTEDDDPRDGDALNEA